MIRTDNSSDIEAIAKMIGHIPNWEADHCIARIEDGELLGGTIYTDYTGPEGSILLHVASFRPRWINRDLLWATFHFPFVVCDCRKIFGQIKASNKASLKFNLNLGFKAETVIKHVYPDNDDMLLVSMYRHECRWLNLRGVKIKHHE